jgi:hypothetical protein
MIKAAICLVILLAIVITVAVLVPETDTPDEIPLMPEEDNEFINPDKKRAIPKHRKNLKEWRGEK